MEPRVDKGEVAKTSPACGTSKNIVFCADGTWNGPNQDDNNDNIPDPTNVYKLFLLLSGALDHDSIKAADEQEKELVSQGGVPVQVSKYLHGVGDSRNPFVRVMGGAFGAGIITRIVRGYTFISRNYQAGDQIYIVGFSRGAYTARALAGFIAKRGLLAKELTSDKEKAYRRGAQAWYRYRRATCDNGLLQRLAEYAADLPAFLSCDSLKESDFAPVDEIRAVAVWDTVGALGIPDFQGDRRYDDFRFTDQKLNDKIRYGFHAVSLDEKRVDFTPTLWHARDGVKQILFPGAHADVGGGYPTTNSESALSDAALRWMVGELSAIGVKFSSEPPYDIKTYPGGIAHQPWNGKPYKTQLRKFSPGLIGHCSVAERLKRDLVQPDPAMSPERYAPRNQPKEICTGGAGKVCATCLKG